MNAAKFTLTSTILAAVLGLALGLAAPPAVADQVNKPGGEHNHTKKGEPLLDVTVLISPGHDTVGTECVGLTLPQGGLSADIFSMEFCAFEGLGNPPLLPVAPDVGNQNVLYAFSVAVKNFGKKASETTGSIYFTTNPEFFPGSDGDTWVLESVRLMIDVEGDCAIRLFPFEVQLGRLIKIHQPGKGELTSESVRFELHEICYEIQE